MKGAYLNIFEKALLYDAVFSIVRQIDLARITHQIVRHLYTLFVQLARVQFFLSTCLWLL